MKRNSFFLVVISCILFFQTAVAADEPLTLERAYELTLKRSEDIAMKAEAIRRAEGRFYEALSGLMPRADFVITRQEQDAPQSSGASSESASSTLLRRSTPQKKFVFNQPLFTGFKEFAAIRGAGSEKAQRQFEKKRAEELLFVDVMEAFYNWAEARKAIGIIQEIQRLYKERLGLVAERVRLGRSRESEGQTTLLDLKLAEAQLEDARRFEVVSRQLLEFYIGREIAGAPAEGDSKVEPDPALPRFLAKKGLRSDVAAAREAYELERHRVTVAQSGFLPSAKLDGNYYTQRVGLQSGINWDVLLTVDVPIFEGTKTVGEVKEAVALREAARLNLSKAERMAELEIKNAFETFTASKRQAAAYRAAAAAARSNFQSHDKEYRLNLISNLEALDALRLYEDTELKLNASDYGVKRDYWKLKVSAGEIK